MQGAGQAPVGSTPTLAKATAATRLAQRQQLIQRGSIVISFSQQQ